MPSTDLVETALAVIRLVGAVPTDRTSAVRRQIRAHPIASSQLSVLQPLRKCEIL